MSQPKTWTVIIHRDGYEPVEMEITARTARRRWYMYNHSFEPMPKEGFEIECVKEVYLPKGGE